MFGNGNLFGDGDLRGRSSTSSTSHARNGGCGVSLLDDYFFSVDLRRRLVVVTGTVDGVDNVLGSALKTVTEGVELTVFVVISHVLFELSGRVDGCSSSLYSNFLDFLLRIGKFFSALTVGWLSLVGFLGVAIFDEVLGGLTELGGVVRLLDVSSLSELGVGLTVNRLLYFGNVLTLGVVLCSLTVARLFYFSSVARLLYFGKVLTLGVFLRSLTVARLLYFSSVARFRELGFVCWTRDSITIFPFGDIELRISGGSGRTVNGVE
jgi:hypothetical protein